MIEVTEKYYIEDDGVCVTVLKRKFNEKKQEYEFISVCYPRSIKDALSKILRLCTVDELAGKEVKLKEALKIMSDLHDRFEKLLSEYVKE